MAKAPPDRICTSSPEPDRSAPRSPNNSPRRELRSGFSPVPGAVRATDVRNRLADAVDGAVAVYHCIHGSHCAWLTELPRAGQTMLEVAGRAGAVVVFPERLYSYGPVDRPMTEDMPRTADFGKPAVRAQLLRARDASPTPTVSENLLGRTPAPLTEVPATIVAWWKSVSADKQRSAAAAGHRPVSSIQP